MIKLLSASNTDPDSSPDAPNNSSAWSPGSIVSNYPYPLKNCNQYFKIASNTKITEKNMKIDDKVTFYYPPPPETFPTVPPKYYAQYLGLTFSNSPYSLRNRNFCATCTTTKTPQKNPKITIGDKFTLRYTPVPDSSSAAPSNDFDWFPVSTVSKIPYSLRNRNQYFKIAQDTQKPRKNGLMTPKLMTLMLMVVILLIPPMLLKTMLSQQTPKIPIFIDKMQTIFQKFSQHQKIILKISLMPLVVVPKLLLTMMLLMPPILLTMILAPQTPKHLHSHWEKSIMSLMLMMIILPPPMMLPPPTIS